MTLSFAAFSQRTYTVSRPDGNFFIPGCTDPDQWLPDTVAGHGTFAAALYLANNGLLDEIHFDLAPGNNVINTTADNWIPTLCADNVLITGKTAAGDIGVTIVGRSFGDALVIEGNDNVVQGLNIIGTLKIDGTLGGGTGNQVKCNYFNTDITGLAFTSQTVPNGGQVSGVLIDNGASGNLIGASTKDSANVFVYTENKIQIAGGSSDNIVRNNYIGVYADGSTGGQERAAANNGVFIYETSTNNTITENVISGNTGHGIRVQASNGNDIIDNIIGLNEAGNAAIPNGTRAGNPTTSIPQYNGVDIAGSANVVIEGNTVSGNYGYGINVTFSDNPNLYSNNVTITGNIVGLDVTGLLAFGNEAGGVLIQARDGDGNPANANNYIIGGTTADTRNIISANGNRYVPGVNTIMEPQYKLGHGLELRNIQNGAGSFILGNYIGTNINGAAVVDINGDSLGNHLNGIYLRNTSNVRVGGTTADSANYTAGNGWVYYKGREDVYVNPIPGDPDPFDNGRRHGIQTDGFPFTGGDPSENNVIVGNVVGIGTGGEALGNGGDGISIYRSSNGNIVGGGTAAEANEIANQVNGIFIQNASSNNVVQGNDIHDNTTFGVFIQDNSSNNIVGGNNAGEGNSIRSNGVHGILIQGVTGTQILGNTIGGSLADANGVHGIQLQSGATNTTIGNTTTGGNDISFNGGKAVDISGATTTGIRVVGNSMNCNTDMGISLNGTGNNTATLGIVEINTGDGNAAAISGRALNYPAGSQIHVYAIDDCSTSACKSGGTTNDIHVQGKTFLGVTTLNTSREFLFAVPGGYTEDQLTVTATDIAGNNTSEFASCYFDPPCVDPGTVTVTATGSTSVCAGDAVTIQATTQNAGTFEYRFYLNGSITPIETNSTGNYDATVSGTYTVTVVDPIDASICSSDGNTSINVTVTPIPDVPTATGANPLDVCEDDMDVVYSVVDDGFVYNWTVPAPASPDAITGASITVDFPAPGSSAISVTASAPGNTACTSAALEFDVNINAKPTVSVDPTPIVVCEGDPITLAATSNGSITWAGPNGFTGSNSPVQVTTSAVEANEGTYTATATLNGCVSDAIANTVDVTVNANPEIGSVTADASPYCQGDDVNLAVTLNNSADLTNPTFAWTGPNGFTSPDQNPTISNVQPAAEGTYNVTVTASSCSSVISQGSVAIVVNANPVVSSVTADQAEYCEGEDVQLSVNLSNSGVLNAPSFAWTGPNGFTSMDQNPLISGVALNQAGTYSVTVTDLTCSDAGTSTGDVDVVVNDLPEASISVNGSSQICIGADATIEVTFTGGTAPYAISYQDPSGGTQNQANINTNPFQILSSVPGTYTLTSVSDDNGCTGTVNAASDDVVITEYPELLITPITSTCELDQLNFTAQFTISGGTAPYAVASTPNVGGSIDGSGVFTSGLVPESSTVQFEVTDASGCTGPEYVIQDQATRNCSCLAEGVMSGGGEICDDGETTDVIVTLSNGTTPYEIEYTIDGGTPIVESGITTPTFTITTSQEGSYVLTSVSDLNCTGSANGSATVTKFALPTATITSAADAICSGTTSSLTLTLTGRPGFEVDVNFPSSGVQTFSSSSTSLNIPIDEAGNYTINEIRDAVTGKSCSNAGAGSGDMDLTIFPDIVLSNAATACTADQNNYTLTFDVAGGDPGSYAIAGGNVTGSFAAGVFTSDPIPEGTDYTITVTDVNDCDPQTITGTSPTCDCAATGTLSLAGNGRLCAGGTVQLQISASGGTGNYTAQVQGPSGVIDVPSFAGSTTFDVSEAGTYELINISDANCTTDFGGSGTTATVVQLTDIVVSNISPVCQPNQIEYVISFSVSGGDPASYSVTGITGSFTGSVFTSDPIAEGTDANFTVTDADDCNPVVESVPSPTCTCAATATLDGANFICEDPASTTDLRITFSGGVRPYSFSYDAAGTVVTVNNHDANVYTFNTGQVGTYQLISVSDQNCDGQVSGTATLAYHPTPAAPTIIGTTSPDCESIGNTYTVSPDNSGSGSTYAWTMPSFGTISSTPTNAASIEVDYGRSTTSASLSVREVSPEGCIGDPGSITVGLLNCNIVPDIAVDRDLICRGESVTYTNTTQNAPAGTEYTWLFPGGTPSSATGEGPHTVTYNTIGFKDVTLTLTNTGEPTNPEVTETDFVFVKALPTPTDIIDGDTTVCRDDEGVVYSVVNPNPGSTYYWETGRGSASFRDDINVGESVTVDFGKTDFDTLYVFEIDFDGCESAVPDRLIIWKDTIKSVPGPPQTINDVQQIVLNGEASEIGIGMVFPFERFNPIEWTSSVNNNEITGNPLSLTTTAIPTENPTYYRLEVTNPVTGCSDIDSVAIFIDYELIIPTGFSPNVDGENDTWEIWNIDRFPDNKVEIYNRWGSLVWETENYTNDDGWYGQNMSGKDLPIGTYFFVVTINNNPSHEEPYSGPVTIIK